MEAGKPTMLDAIKGQANYALTENEALTHASTLSDCLDLFATIGALRGGPEADILLRFERAWAEEPLLAMKILFFARDIRGGLGERRVFRLIARWMAIHHPASFQKNLGLITKFGRFDDLLALFDTPLEGEMLSLIKGQLNEDIKACEKEEETLSLLSKWLPSVNASKRETVRLAKRVARALGMEDAEYRRMLSRLRARVDLLENRLREKDYSFDYERQPSRAMLKYRKAFFRNDEARYRAFLERVKAGEARLNTGTLIPYDLVRPILRGSVDESERESLDISWKALEDFTGGEDALCVIDGSGSMYIFDNPSPAAAALSLGIYFAQRNRGAFRNHFITFSNSPRLVEIKGRDLWEQVRYCRSYDEIANTDIKKVFELILQAALDLGASQKDLPETLYIISDMEFDKCAENADLTNFQYAEKLYASHGYRLPQTVFWNVASRGTTHQPVTFNQQGVALVSGFSPRLYRMVAGKELEPYRFMMEALNSERYDCVRV